MSKLPDLLGSLNDIFQIGLGTTGAKTLRFRNGFTGDLSWNPTANRTIELPNASGTLALDGVGAVITHSVAQTLGSNINNATLNFDTEEYDPNTSHAGSDTFMTCRRTGLYLIGIAATFSANAMGIRQLSININGLTTIATEQRLNLGAGSSTPVSLSTVALLNSSDLVFPYFFQNSGVALNVTSPRFYITKL